MAESTRSITKKAGAAAFEKALESFLPALFQRLDRLDERIASLDRELHGLREHLDSRFEQSRNVMNELAQRIARIEGRLEGFTATVNRQSDKMDQWIKRLVRLELGPNARRGRRAS